MRVLRSHVLRPTRHFVGREDLGWLLQILDELRRGCRESRMVLDAAKIVPKGRESAIGMASVDGQMVAGMKRTVARKPALTT